MPPSDRFRPIQKLVSQKERKAAAMLGESLKQRAEAKQQLDKLRQYLEEYLERFSKAVHKGLTSRQILEYQVFIDKLEVAIAQQEQAVVQSQQALDASKAQWQGRYRKSRAMDNAVARMQAEETKQEERLEQKDSDERAQRKR